MKRGKIKKRFKFRRKLASLFFLAGFGIAGVTAQAQQTPAPALPAKTYMKQSVFYLPVKIDERVRSTLREVRLYCKEGASRPWQLKDKATPGQTYFTFRAPHDGEYWFTVVTVNKSGQSTPSDLRNEPPGLIVVQDTQLPQVDVHPAGTTDEGTLVQCVIRDANPDFGKTHFYYQTGDGGWQSPMRSSIRSDQYCIPAQAVFTGMVRVEATDLAGNTMNREFNLGAIHASQPGHSAGQTVAQATNAGTKVAPVKAPAPAPFVNDVPAPFPVETVENVVVPKGNSTGPELVPINHQGAAPSSPVTSESKIVEPITDDVKDIVSTAPPRAAGYGAVQITESHEIDSPAAQTRKATTGVRHLVNKTHVYLNYQIENKGPSGVGKIGVYVTRDQGQSWQKLGAERDAKSPIEFDLPAEGLYGVSLAVTNGRGFGGNAPAPGDAPEWAIEVDVTKPTARLIDIRSSNEGDSGGMIINWNAQDKNLAAEPIDLYYAVSREGPWQPIAKGLRNDGHYRWEVPGNVGAEAFIRLVARDAAGNATICDTAQGVTLDDHSRPRARVLSVGTAPPRNGD
jgi:hypothetical protein